MVVTLMGNAITSLIALIIILDPFLGMVLFITLTKGMDKKEKARMALTAVGVAFMLLVIFLFSGLFVLNLLGISLPSFRVAGGVILLLMGIQAVLGIEFTKKAPHAKQAAAIIIGTPLLCGPGSMTTIILLSQQYGYLAPLIASFLAAAFTWLLFMFADTVSKRLGERMIEVISRVMGLMLCGLAIEFIKDGIVGMVVALIS